jgi:hypothetical protein
LLDAPNTLRRLAGAKTVQENAQIVFFPRIETTDCEENAQIVFFLEFRSQTVRKMHRLYFFIKLIPQTDEDAKYTDSKDGQKKRSS